MLTTVELIASMQQLAAMVFAACAAIAYLVGAKSTANALIEFSALNLLAAIIANLGAATPGPSHSVLSGWWGVALLYGHCAACIGVLLRVLLDTLVHLFTAASRSRSC